MQIINKNKNGENVPVMVFKNERDGKVSYQLGLNKKVLNENGEEIWQNGYIKAVFNKDVNIENKTKIYLSDAILDFFQVDTEKGKNTIPFIRVFTFYTDIKPKQEQDSYITIEDDTPLPF